MKALLLTLSFVAFSFSAVYAQTIRVVDNNPNAPTGTNVYKTLQAAVDAAAPGDIIHVMPSLEVYGISSVDKKLTILGTGFDPKADRATKSVVASISLIGGSSGTRISGLTVSGISISANLDGITIENSSIGGIGSGGIVTNFTIRNCILGDVNLTSGSAANRHNNILISNNVCFGDVNILNATGATITNNVFLEAAPSIGSSGVAATSLQDCVFANNILYGAGFNSTSGGILRNTFNNNLIYRVASIGGTPADDFPTGNGNAQSNNIKAQDPQFVSFPANGASAYSSTFDLRLQATSPAKGKGTDGTDIGIFGGQFPFNSIFTGGTPIPLIQTLNTAGVIKAGTDLSVTIRAKAK